MKSNPQRDSELTNKHLNVRKRGSKEAVRQCCSAFHGKRILFKRLFVLPTCPAGSPAHSVSFAGLKYYDGSSLKNSIKAHSPLLNLLKHFNRLWIILPLIKKKRNHISSYLTLIKNKRVNIFRTKCSKTLMSVD